MRRVALSLVLLTALAPAAGAQSLLEGWDEGAVTIYGWFPTITGAQDGPDGQPIVDLDGADVLAALDFAFFGSGEIRRDRVGLLFDVEYADLSQDGAARGAIIPGAAPASAGVGTTLLMATAAVAYRLVDQPRGWVDIYGGLRAYDIEADFKARIPAIDFRVDRTGKANWVDGIVGLRGHAEFGRGFGVTALADVGGGAIGGSELAWQATGTLDYAFTERWVGRVGYRYMRVDYDSNDLSLDVDIHGPLAGITYRF